MQGVLAHGFGKELHGVFMLFGMVHRHVRAAEDGFESVAVLRILRNPDAHTQVEAHVVDMKR